jgi:hypothetical protein
MKIRRVITGGCSFSDPGSNAIWIYRLEEKVKAIYPNVTFRHVGFNGQGQELIQKKISLALTEEINKFTPDEILVLPMWSGTERKAFWIDNKLVIEEIVEEWPKIGVFGSHQFLDLKSKSEIEGVVRCKNTGSSIIYNKNGGWYNCHYHCPDSQLSKEFFNSTETVIGFITYSLENIIFLQNLCTILGVKLFHSFYRNYVYDDIIQNKDHLNLKYLFSMLDHDKIISTTGIFEYLKNIESTKDMKLRKTSWVFMHIIEGWKNSNNSEYFEIDKIHPNKTGSQKWVDEVLFPTLQSKGIL